MPCSSTWVPVDASLPFRASASFWWLVSSAGEVRSIPIDAHSSHKLEKRAARRDSVTYLDQGAKSYSVETRGEGSEEKEGKCRPRT
ncbi:hypothetical protein LX36DRAFT_662815 [Colletotrichum falcatum]|nr:hypothetical protein LX36DRAFT_662815 [Colletotrichum falcatum]